MPRRCTSSAGSPARTSTPRSWRPWSPAWRTPRRWSSCRAARPISPAARAAGSEQVVAVVSPSIAEAVHARLPGVQLAEQSPALGTGHAAEVGLAALPEDVETVVILYGDTPAIRPDTIRRVIEARAKAGA